MGAERRVRLHIDGDAPELHAVPWEMLYGDDVMLAANAQTPFALFTLVAVGESVKTRPVRVLAVISNPKDLQARWSARARRGCGAVYLPKRFSRLPKGDVELTFLQGPVTMASLGDALRDGYHVVHYVGHGKFGHDKQRATLLMQDADGYGEEVADGDLSAMLGRQALKPRLVFLAACQSAARSRADAFMGLAPRLGAGRRPGGRGHARLRRYAHGAQGWGDLLQAAHETRCGRPCTERGARCVIDREAAGRCCSGAVYAPRRRPVVGVINRVPGLSGNFCAQNP